MSLYTDLLLITFFLFNEFQRLLVLSACTGQQTTYTPLLLQKQGLHPTCWQIKVLQVFVLGLPMASVLTEFPALLPPTKWLCRNSWLWLLSVVETRFFCQMSICCCSWQCVLWLELFRRWAMGSIGLLFSFHYQIQCLIKLLTLTGNCLFVSFFWLRFSVHCQKVSLLVWNQKLKLHEYVLKY